MCSPSRTKVVIALALSLLANEAAGQDKPGGCPKVEPDRITYCGDGGLNIANPERGFYFHTETKLKDGKFKTVEKDEDSGALDSGGLADKRKEGVSIILRLYYLNKSEEDVSRYIPLIAQDMRAVRGAGMKAILRFAYTTHYTDKKTNNEEDAPAETALAHISQLAPIFRDNADVIAVVQAGFLGTWGEWYSVHKDYGDNHASPFNPRRIAVVKKLLEVIPVDRSVQLRSFYYKRSIDKDNPRLGFHNDCIGAGLGTQGLYYPEVDCKKNAADGQCRAVAEQTKSVPMGGERCSMTSLKELPLIGWDVVSEEFARNHWSYFLLMDKNEKSDSLFFTQWGQNIETMKRRLGYRLLLQDATFKRQVATGAPLEVEANLINVGWAAPFNARSVRLMLIPAAGGAAKSCPAEGAPAGCESVSAAADPRTWLPDARHTISGVIPTGKLPAGEYYLALEMADPLITKVNVTDDGIRARYSIRLANEEKQDGHFRWNPAEGLNYLGKVTLTK